MDKRRRNTRVSTYRPRTDAQKERRRALRAARADERLCNGIARDEPRLAKRLEELEGALRDDGRTGIHKKRHVRALDDIADEAERIGVLKARVERLEALRAVDQRKRLTRAKILMGGAVLAEILSARAKADETFSRGLLDVFNRRITSARDRMIVSDLVQAPLSLAPETGGVGAGFQDPDELLPDFDEMAHSAMAEHPNLSAAEAFIGYWELDPIGD